MRHLTKWTINILLILVVLTAIFAILLPSIFSTRLAVVLSSSMSPAMPAGSLAAMTPVDPTAIQVGDIISFKPPWDPDVITSHRVINIQTDGQLLFDTKGDAVEDSDPYFVTAMSVIGRVTWHIPYVGTVLNEIKKFTSSIWGFTLLVVLPAVLIFGSAIRDVNFMYSSRKRRARLVKKREEYMKRRAPKSWQLRRAV